MKQTIVALGRAGDLINLLPLAYFISRNGGCDWLVGEEFAQILEGVSYVNPLTWSGGLETYDRAVRFARRSCPDPRYAQCHHNPDQTRQMRSFCDESWRLAGYKYRNVWPLIFDRRNPKREKALIKKYIDSKRKNVLVGTLSLSSPFPKANELIAKLRGLDANIIDLDQIKAERIYDLIGLYDHADLIVSVDTVHVHLARACYTPLMAIVNDGWFGSRLPPQISSSRTYSEFDLDIFPRRLKFVLEGQDSISRLTLVVDVHGDTPRHRRARATWPENAVCTRTKKIPRFKDVLRYGLLEETDVIVWTNDDVQFKRDTASRILKHAKKFPFGCSRRDQDHVGREIFWFRKEWLEKNIDEMPDVYIARAKFDLVIARWLRQKMGIETTEENLSLDFAPIEVPLGLISHESHRSSWIDKVDEETILNETIWSQSNN